MFSESMNRRDLLKGSVAAVAGLSASHWLNVLAAHASTTRTQTKSCILLWMAGGPSHKDTFDLRPGTAQGGPFREIDTAAPGVRISEHMPNIARFMDKMAIIRSIPR